MAKPIIPPAIDVLAEYRAAVNATPNSAEAETNLGWGLYSKGDFDEAIKAFDKAISLEAAYFDAYYGLALTYKKAGRAADAVATFKKALTLVGNTTDNKPRILLMTNIIDSHLQDLHAA
jgi:tetratricopeptide (TPR) repeat protein